MNKKIKIGYTTGVFDLFHIGHLRLLNNSKALVDKLIVGVTVDELVNYKGKKSVIPFEERIEIVSSIKSVDCVVPQYDMDKVKSCKKLKVDYVFVGDDWYEDSKWNKYEEELNKINVSVIYFPYSRGTSSTIINETLAKLRS